MVEQTSPGSREVQGLGQPPRSDRGDQHHRQDHSRQGGGQGADLLSTETRRVLTNQTWPEASEDLEVPCLLFEDQPGGWCDGWSLLQSSGSSNLHHTLAGSHLPGKPRYIKHP